MNNSILNLKSAFANTTGGKLLIGVKDNGRISGIRSEEEAYMAESAAHVFCKPAVTYQLKKWEVEGRTVLEIEIPLSKERPHFAKNEVGRWIAYVRIADQNIKANNIIVNVWKGRKRSDLWLSYGKAEQILLNYLTENEHISLSKFERIARISRINAERVLAKLILMRVVDISISEKTCVYRLKTSNPGVYSII